MDTATSLAATAAWRCTWHTGPDAGGVHELGPGRHLLGRGHPLGCDDPGLHPHHAVLEVHDDGRFTITQLAGKAAARLNGAPLDGETEVEPSSWLELAGSMALLERGPRPPVRQPGACIRDGMVVRGARAVPRWTPTAPTVPEPPVDEVSHVGGLLPAVVGIVGAGLIALLLRQPMFLLFGALGGAAAVASWGGQRVAFARRRRHVRASYHDAVAAASADHARLRADYREHHALAVPTITSALATAHERDAALWERRAAHGDAFVVSLGLGAVPWPLPAEPGHGATTAAPVEGVAVPVDLGPGARVALRGDDAPAMVRAIGMQLASSCGPADVRLMIVAEQPDQWSEWATLPHLTLPDGTPAITDEAGLGTALESLEGRRCHLVVFTDCAAALATCTSPLRRLLADETIALVAVLTGATAVPHLCTAALQTQTGGVAQWTVDTTSAHMPTPVRCAGLGTRSFARAAAALSGLHDPEDALDGATGVPRALTLADLHAEHLPTPVSIAKAWSTARATDPRAVVGRAADGAVDIDLVRDGPHGLLAGTTGAGKSELLRTLIVGMAANSSPAHLTFVLVDYKGGATFDACAALPHVVGVITDLDDQLADRALRSLHAELRRREAVLREHGAADIIDLCGRAPHVVLPRLVVVIDEFAALVAEQPAFLHALVGIAQRGRSLGVHLLLATQRPNGVISDDIRANTNLRIALRLQDTADALDVVGSASAAHLPRRVPGRAVLRLGQDEHLTFQAAQCSLPVTGDGGPTQLQVMVRAIADAARLSGSEAPMPPWQPPLPTAIDRAGIAAGTLGLVDDPDEQRVLPLAWHPDDGHVVVAGSVGAGVSTTLRTLAAHALHHTDRHVFVLDGSAVGGHDEALAGHPRCGAVVHVHERERVARLLRLAHDATTARGSCAALLLVIDGLDAVRRALDDIERTEEHDLLAELLATADSTRLTIAAGVQQPSAVPAAFVGRCPHRWVLHLHDAHDAMTLGVAADRVPVPVPGRVALAERGLTAQLTILATPSAPNADVTCAQRIDITPAVVDASTLHPGSVHEGTALLPIGTGLGHGGTHFLHLHPADHVLVVGGARSGRSTALVRIARAWAALHHDGWMAALEPRRSGPVATLPTVELAEAATEIDAQPGRPALLVVDDADGVDDPDGVLARLATNGRVSIIAGGRPDALRQAYGHWTGLIRRSRLGLVAAGGSDLDGDLLGTLLPRRSPVAPRPGLMWIVEAGGIELVQVATDAAHLAATRLAPR